MTTYPFTLPTDRGSALLLIEMETVLLHNTSRNLHTSRHAIIFEDNTTRQINTPPTYSHLMTVTGVGDARNVAYAI
jgi:hypothetical protein